MTQRLLILFLLVAMASGAQAQDKDARHARKSTLEFSGGYSAGLFRDENFSPLNYSDGGASFRLGFLRPTGSQNEFFIAVDLSTTTLSTASSSFFDTDRFSFDLNLGFLKRLPQGNRSIGILVGPELRSHSELAFFNGVDAVTFFGTHGIDGAIKLELPETGAGHLTSKLSVAIAAILVRPPYTGWDKFVVENEDNIPKVLVTGPLATINDFQALVWQNELRRPLVGSTMLILRHHLRFRNTRQLDLARHLTNEFQVGLAFRL